MKRKNWNTPTITLISSPSGSGKMMSDPTEVICFKRFHGAGTEHFRNNHGCGSDIFAMVSPSDVAPASIVFNRIGQGPS